MTLIKARTDLNCKGDSRIGAMTFWDQLRFWAIAGLAGALFLWLFSGILLPFVAGMAFAYLLDPIVERLVIWKWPRTVAVAVVLTLAMIAGIGVALLIVPIVAHQVALLVERAPAYAEQARAAYAQFQQSSPFGFSPERFDAAVSELWAAISGNAGAIAQRVLAQGLELLNLLSLLLITPVVAFYLMLDWKTLTGTVHSWMPRPYEATLLRLGSEIDRCIAGFVRGQMLVCAIQAAGYALALTLAGLEFGFLIGLLAGALSFIPIVGAVLGLGLSMLVAVFQFWPDWPMIAAIAAIFIAGQLIEGNYLTPKLVGAQVGLHPVWIIFSLLAFGSFFGFVGMLLAVPAAAAIGVLIRFGLEQYLKSPYYRGAPALELTSAETAQDDKG
jgi:predicted PurR-regulated permease PerM